MNRLRLPGPDGRPTTRLGFGCAYLVPETAHLLEVAYDAGIRHFDVGRSYGRGLTEGVLGRFARRHDDITLTSKYGIRPPFSHPLHAVARRLLRPAVRLLRRAPAVNRNLDAAVGISNRKARFSAEECVQSLELSLRNLRVPRLDLFLMHEAQADDLHDPRLLELLQESVARGRIGAFGVGGEAQRLPALLAERPAFCEVLQYDWSPDVPVSVPAGSFSILYRVFNAAARRLRERAAQQPALLAHLSDAAGRDVDVAGVLEQLLLGAALAQRPQALILFSSTQAQHIEQLVRAAGDPDAAAAGVRLLGVLGTQAPAVRLAAHG